MAMTVRSAAPFDGDGVLTLAEAKAHLRRTDNDEDLLIVSLRDAAIDWVERDTSKALTSRSFVAMFDDFDYRLRLPVGPITAVTSVTYLDGDGISQLLAGSDYRLAGDVLHAAGVWPTSLWGSAAGAVTVTFTAGFADVNAEAPGLVAAVKMLLASYYANRGAVQIGQTAVETSLSVRALCDQHRAMVIA